PALSRSTALLRMAVRSLMAQEKNMSASQPHSFLLRSLYHFPQNASIRYSFVCLQNAVVLVSFHLYVIFLATVQLLFLIKTQEFL
ncbi:hypothetical protein, partial [Clostridium sp.]|uniref:hypothetical protein n=1 Tax=Clostridium sp. TaxID=1506 RepID=UPI00257E2D22